MAAFSADEKLLAITRTPSTDGSLTVMDLVNAMKAQNVLQPSDQIDGPPAPLGTTPGYGSGYGVVKTYAQLTGHYVGGTAMTVTVTYPDTANPPANQTPNRVRVVVRYPYQPFFGLGWPTVNVNAAAEGRIMF